MNAVNRSAMLEASKILANREDEIRLAVFHCMRAGINSQDCRDVWFPMWNSEKSKIGDVLIIMNIIQSAASIARGKSKWMNDDSKASILRSFPAVEWMGGDSEMAGMKMRWESAGGVLYGSAERMIAPRYDPIWATLSDYGVPWASPMILVGRDYMVDISAKELKSINLIYEPRGWIAHLLDLGPSSALKLDHDTKTKLLNEVSELRANFGEKPRFGDKARDAILETRLGWIKEFEEKGDEEGAERVRKMIDESFQKHQKQKAYEDLSCIPLAESTVVRWTGDPLNPKDFEYIDPALPTAIM